MKLKLDKKDFEPFLESLMQDYDLYAPVQLAEGVSVYQRINQLEEINLTLPNPQKPLKEVFFPQSEVMFHYEKVGKRDRITTAEEVSRKRVVIGAHPCDIRAISMIHQVFSGEDYIDVYFLDKIKATTIIGMACSHPLSTCFCTSTGGGPFFREGSDLFLIDLGDAYLVELITEKGMVLHENIFLKKADSKDLALAQEIEKEASEKLGSFQSLEGIEKKLDQIVENPCWDRIHEKCIGCRVCTYLCPTCHCFDIVDEASQDKGHRVRNWDSCLSDLYSQETSGHNPRPTGRERTRQRLMHKFNYFPKNFGRIACVGCGRCILYCPTHFDIRQVIQEIQNE